MNGVIVVCWGIVFSALWASAFIAGKIALAFTDPLSLLCVRFAVAGLIMALLFAMRHGLRPLFRRDVLLAGLVMGAFSNALYLGLSFVGLKTLAAEAVILIVSTAPFITTGFSVLFGGRRSWVQLIGAVVGFAGVYLVLSGRLNGQADLWGALAVFVGTVAFSASTVFYRLRAAHHDPMAINAVQNLAGAVLLVPFAPDLASPVLALQHLPFALGFLHLVIAVSIVDFLLWLGLVRRIGAAHASSFHLLNPVFGVALSALFLGSEITRLDLIGGAIVVLGLGLVVRDATKPDQAAS